MPTEPKQTQMVPSNKLLWRIHPNKEKEKRVLKQNTTIVQRNNTIFSSYTTSYERLTHKPPSSDETPEEHGGVEVAPLPQDQRKCFRSRYARARARVKPSAHRTAQATSPVRSQLMSWGGDILENYTRGDPTYQYFQQGTLNPHKPEHVGNINVEYIIHGRSPHQLDPYWC